MHTPYGIDENDGNRVVWLYQVDIENYGERCGLACPECGEPLIAVRRSSDNPNLGFRCFRHKADTHCPGYGESALHRAAKAILADGEGSRFRLPAVSFADCRAHTARKTSSGKRRKYPVEIDGCEFPDLFIKGSSEWATVKKVEIEDQCSVRPANMRPDGVVYVDIGDRRGIPIAIELKNTHGKDIEDARAYERAGLAVIEVTLEGLCNSDGIDMDGVRESIFGGTGFMGMARREWLYCPWALDKARQTVTLEIGTGIEGPPFGLPPSAPYLYLSEIAGVAVLMGSDPKGRYGIDDARMLIDRCKEFERTYGDDLEAPFPYPSPLPGDRPVTKPFLDQLADRPACPTPAIGSESGAGAPKGHGIIERISGFARRFLSGS